MTTKDVLLVVGGVVLGYYASKMNWGMKTSTGLGEVVTGVKDTATGLISDVASLLNPAKSITTSISERIFSLNDVVL